ncbi:hypothetical protein SME46J_23650 [Serratia marcescens]|jgi:hypothetical protein|nr:hypothetical protein SME46J_23650 [Serratia marcescens]BEO60881.1 hypothetical protein SMQE30_13040 [Serratia marcescens]
MVGKRGNRKLRARSQFLPALGAAHERGAFADGFHFIC